MNSIEHFIDGKIVKGFSKRTAINYPFKNKKSQISNINN